MGEPAGEPAAAASSVFTAVLNKLPACSGADGELLTAPFLDACRLVVPVIGARHTCSRCLRPGVTR